MVRIPHIRQPPIKGIQQNLLILILYLKKGVPLHLHGNEKEHWQRSEDITAAPVGRGHTLLDVPRV